MSYAYKKYDYRGARQIARAAIRSPKPGRRLKCCQELLRQLDPKRPPVTTTSNEFRWQYLALRERVQVYAEWLSTVDEQGPDSEIAMYKAENAIVRSLNYFCEALQERKPEDDESDLDDDG